MWYTYWLFYDNPHLQRNTLFLSVPRYIYKEVFDEMLQLFQVVRLISYSGVIQPESRIVVGDLHYKAVFLFFTHPYCNYTWWMVFSKTNYFSRLFCWWSFSVSLLPLKISHPRMRNLRSYWNWIAKIMVLRCSMAVCMHVSVTSFRILVVSSLENFGRLLFCKRISKNKCVFKTSKSQFNHICFCHRS